jgi:hypothetical protein
MMSEASLSGRANYHGKTGKDYVVLIKAIPLSLEQNKEIAIISCTSLKVYPSLLLRLFETFSWGFQVNFQAGGWEVFFSHYIHTITKFLLS